MSEFIGESTIVVKADTRAFLFQVKKAIAEAEKLEATITIRASTAGFRADLIEKVKRSEKGVVANVRVNPDMTGFRARLIEAVKRSSKGVVATVAVVPSAGAAARAAGGAAAAATAPAAAAAGVDARSAAAVQAINTATEAGVAARRRMNSELSIEEKRAARLTRELSALSAAEIAVRRAVVSGNQSLIDQAEGLQRTAAAAVATTRAQQARAAARTPEARAVAAGKQAAAELAARKKLDQEITKAHSEALRENARLDKKAQADLTRAHAAALEENKKRDAQARQARQDVIGPSQTAALVENKQRDLLARQLAASITKQAEAEAKLSNIAKGSVAVEERANAARQAQAASLAAVTNAEKALQTARSIGNKTLIETAEAELARASKARAANISSLSDVKALAEAEKLLAKSVKSSILAEQQVVGAKNEEDAVNKRLRISKSAVAQAAEAEAVAMQITNKELREEILLRAAAQKAAAGQAATDLAAAARRVTANKSVRESILANTLSLLGLRGSALAANAAFLGTSAAIIALAKSVGLAARLESQLNVFQATAGATADQMERVSATAEQLGRDITLPGVGASDAAQALTELSKAGLSVQDSIDGARGVLQLATAASIDNAEATELVASALNSFGLAGDQAVRVADALANAANDSQGSIVDIGVALQQSSAVARQAGLSMEQTVSALTILARAGLRSSDAGTSLRTALLRLINPSKKAQEQINKLGLSVRTSTGAINLGVFDEFAQKTRDFTKAQRDQALAIIFGQDAIRAAAILSRTGAAGLNAQITSIEKQGTAAELANARMKGLVGSAENLKNQLSALGIEVGKVATGPLVLLTNSLADTAGAMADLLGLARKLAETEIIPNIKIGKTDSDSVIKDVLGFAFSSLPTLTVRAFKPVVRDLKGLNKESQSTASDGVGKLISKLSDAQARFGATSKEADKLVLGVVRAGDAFANTAAGVDTVKEKFSEFSPVIKAALEDGVIDPSERATIATTALGRAFLSFIDLPANVNKNIQIITTLVGPNKQPLTTGISQKLVGDIEDASAAAKRAASPFGPEMAKIFARAEGLMTNAARHATTATGDVLEEGMKTAFFRAIAVARRQAGALEDEMNRALIAGAGPGAQNQILQKQFENAQKRIDAANARLAEIKPGDQSKAAKKARERARAERSAALAEQARITGEIKANNEQIAADKKEAADAIVKANNEADQNLLDALAGGRTRFTRAISRAETTPGEDDNVKALQAFRKRLLDEVKQVKSGVKDAKTKATQLKVLSDELFQNAQDIQAARKTRDEAIAQALEDKGTALEELGETTGNIKLVLKGLDLQITAANQTLAKAKQTATATTRAAAELEKVGKSQKKLFTVGNPKGLVEPGNIDLLNRPKVPTPGKSGFTSTVRSITVGIERDGKKLAALIPTVINNKVVSDAAALKHFQKTGENLGIFATEELANAYAQGLHKQQAGLTKSVTTATGKTVNGAFVDGINGVGDAGVVAVQAAVARLIKRRVDVVNDAKNALLEQGFDLAEARGNKSAMLQIIDLQIKQAKAEEKQAKTLLDRLVAQTKIAELINKRKEILEDKVKDGQKTGTTAFDILTEAAQTFVNTGGNLIGGDQPFAGPTGFTADLAQFLRRKKPGQRGIGAGLRPDQTPGSDETFFRGIGGRQASKQESLTSSLIAALEKLTAATLAASDGKSKNASTASIGEFGGVRQGSLAARFNAARQARQVEEG